jgi:hypothetical protein
MKRKVQIQLLEWKDAVDVRSMAMACVPRNRGNIDG